jgi:hypothetical protein
MKCGSMTPKGTSKQEKWLLNWEYSKATTFLSYCLALIPQINMLNQQGAGYEVKGKNKVSHLFEMDD